MFSTVEYSLFAIIAVLLVWLVVLEVRFTRIMRGSKGQTLEAHIARIGKENEEIKDVLIKIKKDLENHDSRLLGSVRGIGLEKFNPFAGNGTSKPSFAIALVSEKGDGVVLSTLHTRDTVSIFTKSISKFTSEKELSSEESTALEKARKSL